jgi:hypothetical protein
VADPREISTVQTLLGVAGLVYAVDRLTRMFPPSSGPRRRPGELTAGQYASQAEDSYWLAETAAARGDCGIAKDHFDDAEKDRRLAEWRTSRGDRTGKDIKGAQRLARSELKVCNPDEGLSGIPRLTKAQSRRRQRELRRKGCKVSRKRVRGGVVVFRDCP